MKPHHPLGSIRSWFQIATAGLVLCATPFTASRLAAQASDAPPQPAAAAAEEEADEVNFDFFYATLKEHGNWLQSEQYGYVFQPTLATEKPDWRPYVDGSWSHTDQGWAWISNEEFGWATYHYGRWAKLPETGWVWVPGYDWAPAWVAWRSSPEASGTPGAAKAGPKPGAASGLIGWAPLPPEATFNQATGIASNADVTYDVGPEDYTFVPTEDFGEATYVRHVRPWRDNWDFFGDTVNVTSISYDPAGAYIYSGGPSFDFIRRISRRAVRNLTIAPQYGWSRRGGLVRGRDLAATVAGDQLRVFAPSVRRPVGVRRGGIGIPTSAPRPDFGRTGVVSGRREGGWSAGNRVDQRRATAVRTKVQAQAQRAPVAAVRPQNLVRPANPVRGIRPGPAGDIGSRRGIQPGQGIARPGTAPDLGNRRGVQPNLGTTRPGTPPDLGNRRGVQPNLGATRPGTPPDLGNRRGVQPNLGATRPGGVGQVPPGNLGSGRPTTGKKVPPVNLGGSRPTTPTAIGKPPTIAKQPTVRPTARPTVIKPTVTRPTVRPPTTRPNVTRPTVTRPPVTRPTVTRPPVVNRPTVRPTVRPPVVRPAAPRAIARPPAVRSAPPKPAKPAAPVKKKPNQP